MQLRTQTVIIRLFNTFFIGPYSPICLSVIIILQWSKQTGLQNVWTVIIRGINREESVRVSRRDINIKDPTLCFSIWFLACSKHCCTLWRTRPSRTWWDSAGWMWCPGKFAHFLCSWEMQPDLKLTALTVWAWCLGWGPFFSTKWSLVIMSFVLALGRKFEVNCHRQVGPLQPAKSTPGQLHWLDGCRWWNRVWPWSVDSSIYEGQRRISLG